MQTILRQNLRMSFSLVFKAIRNDKVGTSVFPKPQPYLASHAKFHFLACHNAKLSHTLQAHYAVEEEDGFQMVRVKAPPGAADTITPGHIEWEKTVGALITAGDVVCRIRFKEDRTLEIKSPVSGMLAARRKNEGDPVQHGDELFKVRLEFAEGSKMEKKKHIKSKERRDYFEEEQEFVGKHFGPANVKSSYLGKTIESSASQKQSVGVSDYMPSETQKSKTVESPPIKKIQQTYLTQSDILPHSFSQPTTTPISHLMTTINEINLEGTLNFVNKFAKIYEVAHGNKPTLRSMYIKAAAHTLRIMPNLNVKLIKGERVERNDIEITVGIRHLKVLVFHTMKGIDKMSYIEISRIIHDVEEQVSSGTYKSEKGERGFTIANEWYIGSIVGTPSYSKTCTLGLHSITKRPIFEGSNIVAYPMMYVSLTYDNSVIDDSDAIEYLKNFKQIMEDPRHILVNL